MKKRLNFFCVLMLLLSDYSRGVCRWFEVAGRAGFNDLGLWEKS